MFILHLNVTVTSALKNSLALQLLKTRAVAVTSGGGGGGGAVVGGGLMVKRGSFNVFLICESLSNRAITCIRCFPTLTFLNVCPEMPMIQKWNSGIITI